MAKYSVNHIERKIILTKDELNYVEVKMLIHE